MKNTVHTAHSILIVNILSSFLSLAHRNIVERFCAYYMYPSVHYRKYLLVDPSLKEEKVTDGKMVIGMNKHREICTLQMTGSMLLMKDQVGSIPFLICSWKSATVLTCMAAVCRSVSFKADAWSYMCPRYINLILWIKHIVHMYSTFVKCTKLYMITLWARDLAELVSAGLVVTWL